MLEGQILNSKVHFNNIADMQHYGQVQCRFQNSTISPLMKLFQDPRNNCGNLQSSPVFLVEDMGLKFRSSSQFLVPR